MTIIRLKINDQDYRVDVDPSTPLLWVLRDHLGLTGTKFGCGVAQCGACTVHLNGHALRSCSVPVDLANNGNVTTVEGLSQSGGETLQALWVEMNVPQCGYCQSGMLMAAADLLKRISDPSDDDIDRSISNICRCGTYPRIRAAIKRAARVMVMDNREKQ